MVKVLKERLDEQMNKERIDRKLLEDVTYKGLYINLCNGVAPKKDIEDVATVLNCTVNYLLGNDAKGHKPESVKIISEKIRERYKSLNWNSNSFSDYTGMPKGSISVYIGKDQYIGMDTAIAIAYGLNCSIEYISGRTDSPLRTSKYKLPDKYSKNRSIVKIDPSHIKSAIRRTPNCSPSELAAAICIPYGILKTALVNGYLPEYCANKVKNILASKDATKATKAPVEEHRVLEAKDKVVKANDLAKTYVEQKEQEKLDKEAAKELAAKVPEMVNDFRDQIMSLSKPKNGYISTGQLLSIAEITAKKPELLDLFAKMCKLSDSDYNAIVAQIDWMVARLL